MKSFRQGIGISLPHNYRPLTLLLLSGAFGFIAGAVLYPDWQVCVEMGQVMAGIVHYPSHAVPQYMCLVKTWSLLNQICAIMLRLGISEVMTSLIVSGIIGALTFQALTMVFFSINRNMLLSLAIPFFICFMSYVGFGVVYPILLMESPHSFGRIGLAFAVVVIGLFGSGCLKTGSFLLGLALCVHPSMGAYCIGLVVTVMFLFRGDYKGTFKKLSVFFFAGLTISLFSYLYQRQFISSLPLSDIPEKQAYITSFIKYWDYHRIPFRYFSPGFAVAGIAAIVCFAVVRFRKIEDTGPLFIMRIYIVSFLVSALLPIITYLPTTVFTTLHILMPGRYINLNNMLCVTIMLGILTAARSFPLDKLVFSLFVVGSLATKLFLPQTAVQLPHMPLNIFYDTPKDLQLIARSAFTVLLPLAVLFSMIFPALCKSASGKGERLISVVYKGSLGSLLLLSAVMVINAFTVGNNTMRITDPVLKAAAARKGMLLLSTDERFPIHMALRRPTPIDPNALDGFLLAPESALQMNAILGKIYGLNILVPPLKEGSVVRNSGTIPCIYRELWEGRSGEDWLKIRREFGITDVLTRSEWRLHLPVASTSTTYTLYTIPDSLPVRQGSDR